MKRRLTPEEFVYWLKGYLEGPSKFSSLKISTIMERLCSVDIEDHAHALAHAHAHEGIDEKNKRKKGSVKERDASVEG